jgi:hypothetical protein
MEDNNIKVQKYNIMKKYKDAESLFDNVEEQDEKENMTAAGTSQNGNVPTPIGGESAFSADYLEKILQIQRNFDRQQEQNAKILETMERLVNRLEGCKNIKVSLSEEDKNMLSDLPITINKHVANTVGQAGQKVKEDIDKHTDSTLKTVSKACDRKTEKVMEVINSGKGIYISLWNFWAMILMTMASVGYAIYAAFNRCLWDVLWEKLWFPLLVLLFFGCLIGLIFWLNLREYRIPKY